jgi:hypothetical protein
LYNLSKNGGEGLHTIQFLIAVCSVCSCTIVLPYTQCAKNAWLHQVLSKGRSTRVALGGGGMKGVALKHPACSGDKRGRGLFGPPSKGRFGGGFALGLWMGLMVYKLL